MADAALDHSATRAVRNLPNDHLISMIIACRRQLDPTGRIISVYRWDTRVDWGAVSRRLTTPEGRTEAREWVNIGGLRRLFFHCLLEFDFGEYSLATHCCFRLVREAYEAYPDAITLPDSTGRYAPHIMCGPGSRVAGPACIFAPRHSPRWSHEHAKVFRWAIGTYPEAAWTPDNEGRTPLHELVSLKYSTPALLNCVKYILNADASVALMQGVPIGAYSSFPKPEQGDALDFACLNYFWMINALVRDQATTAEDEESESDDSSSSSQPGLSYTTESIRISTKIRTLAVTAETRRTKRRLGFILVLLRALYDGRPFLPLHASVQGCLCRPWHLVVMTEIIRNFGQKGACKTDADGNLPLHLFLESCMNGQERALEKRFCGDGNEYNAAVAKCFEMILAANPRAANAMNGEGRHPLHLAIASCPSLYEEIITPLLNAAPKSLLARDIRFRLYPFAAAGIGTSAHLDTVFMLLRRDPSVLSGHSAPRRGRRKRKTRF